MKVLLVTNYRPGRGGISGQVELIAKYLSQESHEATIFSTRGSVFYRLKVLLKLIHISKRYDVIHSHGCSGTGMIPIIYGVIAGRWSHRRVVATYHGGGADSFFARHTYLVKRYLTKTDTNIVLSGFLGKVFDKYKIPYSIIPNIVELDPKYYRERLSINPHFISIRTLSPLYNIECIIRAFQIVKRNIPEATLTIVGDGPSRAALEKMVAECRIQDVIFTGRVPNSSIYEYLDKSDIMLSASRVDNMPVSVLEAFNAGLLVISSDVGGVPYIIEDGNNGLLFSSGDEVELSDKMQYAVNYKADSIRMIHNAYLSLTLYSWGNIWPSLAKIYDL